MTLDSLAADLIEITPRLLVLIRQRLKVHATSDLTMPQMRILSQLKNEGLSNSELADRIGVDITSMSRMADCLVKRGFITRSVNPDDKRFVKLQLSAQGRREQEAAYSDVKDWIAHQMEALTSSEKTELSQGLKVLARLENLILQTES